MSTKTTTNAGWAFVLYLIAIVPSALLWGLVLRDLWAWFAVPLGAPAITIAQAVGLSILGSYFKYGVKRDHGDDDEEDLLAKAVGHLVETTLFVLLLWAYGALWHQFAF